LLTAAVLIIKREGENRDRERQRETKRETERACSPNESKPLNSGTTHEHK
jgi:hypothetical protein